tara:strand:+ start:3307 stop:3435 length:129 start_codon:yes stop_codon:yes gene_type:complete
MIKDAVSYVVTGALGFAILGLIGAAMLKDSLEELQVVAPKKQ